MQVDRLLNSAIGRLVSNIHEQFLYGFAEFSSRFGDSEKKNSMIKMAGHFLHLSDPNKQELTRHKDEILALALENDAIAENQSRLEDIKEREVFYWACGNMLRKGGLTGSVAFGLFSAANWTITNFHPYPVQTEYESLIPQIAACGVISVVGALMADRSRKRVGAVNALIEYGKLED